MTFVKICGITNLKDALLATTLGAHQIGLNFYGKSPRFVSPEVAAEICGNPGVTALKVGVFVDEDEKTIAATAASVGLDAIQLHGNESARYSAELRRRTGLRIIKAFRVSPEFSVSAIEKYEVDSVLLDTYSARDFGGTGERFDWQIALRARDMVQELYLAGGISAENVAQAISEVQPYCVDACSRLESAPGAKDESKMRLFMKNAGVAS